MGMGVSDSLPRGNRGRVRPDARSRNVRRSRLRRMGLEGLETRTLLATIPAAAATGLPQNLSSLMPTLGGLSASQNSTTVQIDPTNPSKMVALWIDSDPALDPPYLVDSVLEGVYTINAGQTWTPLFGEPGSGLPVAPILLDPNTFNPTVPYLQVSNPSLAFDRNDNFYIVESQHNAGGTSGAIVMLKFSFSGDSPTGSIITTPQSGTAPYRVLYQWLPADDFAIDPTVQVDSNLPSFVDPTTGEQQTDPNSGNVYVSWAGVVVPPAGNPLGAAFNPNPIYLTVSSDGGKTFSPVNLMNTSTTTTPYGPTAQRDDVPQIVVSQGRLPSESGIPGDTGIPGGEVTVSWDNFGANQNELMTNTIAPGHAYQFTGSGGIINPGTKAGATITSFPQAISIPASDINSLDALNLTVAATDSNLAMLGMILVAPNGDSFTLFAPQSIGGAAITTRGISGSNLGVNNGFAIGTTFTDSAARSIVDINPVTLARGAAAPFIGNYRPEDDFFTNPSNTNGTTLNAFLATEVRKGDINGTWTLETVDTNTSPTTPPNFVNFWTLSLSTGLTPDANAVVVGGPTESTFGLVVPGSVTPVYPTAAPSSPVGIGPGLAMVEDNTLGSFSPYEGRIYLAFVGYYNITIDGVKNPTTNTDIFLTYSDNAGRTWSNPVQVNDDTAALDGYSAANTLTATNPDIVTGRTQFQPELAVDPTTGTLVISWRDARDDAANARVATYIATSIDGGQSFSPQTYANPQNVAIDAATGQDIVLGPKGDNESSGNSHTDATYGYGTSMGLAVSGGQVYPIWAGNFNQSVVVNGAVQGLPLSVYYRPMVIAAGPRIVNSTQGPITYAAAASGTVSFDVTFDRPINPPSLSGYTTTPTFYPADVLVYYHDTTNGDASIPLQVLSVAPIASSGVGPDNKFGYTQFKVTFSTTTQPDGTPSGITNYTGTYSYMITPDDGSGTAISSPISSYVVVPVAQPVIGPVPSTNVPLAVPTSGTGGSGTSDDITTSTIKLAGYTNQSITGIQVNLTLGALGDQYLRDGAVTITLVAPNGQSALLYSNPGYTGLNFINTTFSDSAATPILQGAAPYTGTFRPLNPLSALNGSAVNGTYQLVIDDRVANNTATLQSWSITVESSLPSVLLQEGAPMDQNADGKPDQNPLLTPYTGLTPGDVYAVPMPQPVTPVTFGPNPLSILSPPFNQTSVPLIVPGPQILSTSVPGASGTDNLVVNGTVDTVNVNFDRPMQVSSFTPSDVLQIMGPTGSISGPQNFPNSSVDQTIPKATPSANGTLNSTLTVSNYQGTFTAADVTVGLTITSPSDSSLSATLVSPSGTEVPLFANVGGNGQNFTNTVFDDAAETSITAGTAPFTGTYQPVGKLANLIGSNVSGVWTLQITNNSQTSSGILVNWSLNITPQLQVTPVNPVNGTATTFQIGFPIQTLSGTYTLQLGPDILDTFGDGLDTTQSAGLAVLRDQGQNSPTTTVYYPATDLPKTIPAPNAVGAGVVESTIVVPDNFLVLGDTTSATQVPSGGGSGISTPVSGLRVQVNLAYPTDPDLSATLYYDLGGPSQVSVPLFDGVGSGTQTANFSNTVFDDNATTPIQNGSAPFFATFNPQMPLSAFAGLNAAGTWTLVLQNSATGSGATGTLLGWSLSFQKLLPTTGIGVPGADNASLGFRIFSLGQTTAQSSEQWTAVGPAAITGASGQVSAIAVDPSDPSGNTVYVAGASGGIWKTTDFLTTGANGPTYIPLTDFGPSSGIYVNSIAIFARNQNPNQSMIIAGTGSITGGEGHTGTTGVGFLISMDGGATWNLYDSTGNIDSSGNLLPIDSTSRNREFVGETVNKVVVDPKLSPDGQVIIYAALSGPNGGIWRSEDTGQTWQQMLTGNATDVALDPDSGVLLNPDSNVATYGNLQVVYAGMEGQGVFMSPNQGQVWNLMTGGVGNPLIVNTYNAKNVNPGTNPSPNGGEGRIVLATPARTGNAVEDAIYSGWLYAAVATPTGGFFGLFMTKDFGQNWTQVNVESLPSPTAYQQAIPTNDVTGPNVNYAITLLNAGNLYLTLAADPTNPNVVYLGSFGGDNLASDTGLIRVDTTNIWDAHALVPYSYFSNDGGLVTLNSAGAATTNTFLYSPVWLEPIPNTNPTAYTASTTPYLNFIRDPEQPFLYDSTLYVNNYNSFSNSGAGVTWIPFDNPALNEVSGTGYQASLAEIDPTTGLPRLIVGNSQGVWSVLDNNGTVETSIGSPTTATVLNLPDVNRNGDLQLTQFYYGAAQPSNVAAQAADALFYGAAQDNGGPFSVPTILTDGNLQWSVPSGEVSAWLNSSAVAVDQQGNQGLGNNGLGIGTLDQYWFPGSGGADTNFFQVNGIGRTFGLLQQSNGLPTPDPQWPLAGITNFAVNPVNGAEMVISSSTGNIFSTTNDGVTWFDIGQPSIFGPPGGASIAMAYGAPDPNAPEGIGNLGNFIYVGTANGDIWATQDGGGNGQGNNWILVGSKANGLDGSRIESIVTDPVRGSHEAYAVTQNGVYFIANSIPSATNPTPTWVNISGTGSGSIFKQAYSIFGQSYNPTTDLNSTPYDLATTLNSIVADWNYEIPNTSGNPAQPSSGYYPVLFVAANSGVYMSTNDGESWTLFPDVNFGAVSEGGYLPHVNVTSLSLSIGNIDPNTGMPELAGPYAPANGIQSSTPDPNLLLASTFGQGAFAINMAPMLFPSTVAIDPASVSGTAADGTPLVTTPTPLFDGLSEISAFGNATRITIVDETSGDATYGQVIGGFNPANVAGTNIAANWTNSVGNFSIPINAGAFTTNGLKTVELYATDNAGSVGNKITLQFTLNVANITPPTAPVTPTLEFAPYDVTGAPGYTNIATPNLIGVTSPDATVELFQANGQPFNPPVITTADSNGNFTLAFPDMTGGQQGTFGPFTVEAQASNNIGSSGFSNTVTFTIIIGQPSPPSNFSLAPSDDSGIIGDNITDVRKPHFIGTVDQANGNPEPGVTVDLFEVGSSTVWATATTDSQGDFSVQLPFNLTTGQISLYVEVTDLAGNLSNPSSTLTVSIVSTAADYNYNSQAASNPALFSRDATANQLQWLVQTAAGTPPPWFGPSGVPYASVPSNAVPFQGDFDGDGYTDLAYYVQSTATWYLNDSTQGMSSFQLGTPNSSLPVAGYFDANAPEEVGAYTVVNGQGVWTIASATSGLQSLTFGQQGDIPAPGDYLGLGYDQIAVYRPSSAEFLVLNRQTGNTVTFNLGLANSPDLASLVPVPGAYDNLAYFNAGEAERTEAAVYDPVAGVFTILGPSGSTYQVTGFVQGDIPAPADYSGSGSTQAVVYRPSTGQFIGANQTVIATFGQSNDIPITAPLSYRLPSNDPPSGQPQLIVKSQPPALVVSNASFGLTIVAENQNGAIDSNFNGNVSVALPPGMSAVLGGNTTVTAKNGVATFTDLTLSPWNSPISLMVTGAGMTGTTTQAISVTTPAALAFSASNVTVKENAGNVILTVVRTGGYQGAVSVDLATAGGTAVAGVNYTAANEVLNFAAGQNSATVAIPVKNAGNLATPVSVGIVLSNPGIDAVLGAPFTETLVIQNAPAPPPPPLVTLESVELKTNRKHQVTGIVLDLSGAVNASEARAIATYELVAAGSGGSFTTKTAKAIKIKSAAYNAATHQVILTPAPFTLSKPVELVVNGNGPHGLKDAEGRYIDGAHDGVSGTNAVVRLSRGGVTMHALPGGPLAVKKRK
jgi:subtilisin-like proprotein convertase family protein